MGLLGDLVVRIVGNTEPFVRAVNQAGRKMSQFDRDMQKIAKNMIKAGKALTLGLTLPILGIAAAAIKVAGDFETSMNRVRAVTGATAEEMRELEAVARQLGATTQFSAVEAADAMSFLAMAGFEANKIIGALPATLNLAAAAQIDMGQAADIASNILSGFNLEADELAGAIDIMAKTFTSSNTDLVQLGEAMSLVAPISEGLGVSIEETSAAIGILSNAGIQASSAGTGLRKVLSTLVLETDRLGIATKNSEGSLRPLADILDDLAAAGFGATEALEVFGLRGGPAISVLLAQGGDALRDFTEKLKDAGGTAERIAKIQMEGLNGAIKRFTSAAKESGITIGNILIPKIIDLMETVRGLFEWFSALDESTQRMIITYAGMAAAIGPLLIAIGFAIKAFLALKVAVVLLNTALLTNPIGQVALAIGLLVAAFAIALPAIINQRRRFKEYQDQLLNTTEALSRLTIEEQKAVRQRFASDLQGRIEALNEVRDKEIEALDKVAAAQARSTVAAGEESLAVTDARRQAARYTEEVIEARAALDELRLAITKADESIEAATAATVAAIPSVVELGDAIAGEGGEGSGGLVRGVKETTEAVRDLAVAWALHRAANLSVISDLADEARARVVAREKLEEYHEVVKDMTGKTLAVATEAAEEEIQQQRDNTLESIALRNSIFEDQRLHNEKMTAAMEKYREELAAADEAAAEASTQLAQETAEEAERIQRKLVDFILNITNSLASAIASMWKNQTQARIDGLDKELLGEEAYDAAVRAIERKAVQRQNALSTFDILANTAVATIRAWADNPWPLSLVASAAALAAGIASFAALPPIPALAQGGIVTGPTPAMVGEGGQPEIIFPLDQLGDFLSSRGDFDDVGRGDMTVIVDLDGGQILKYVGKAAEDGRLLIRQRAIV